MFIGVIIFFILPDNPLFSLYYLGFIALLFFGLSLVLIVSGFFTLFKKGKDYLNKNDKWRKNLSQGLYLPGVIFGCLVIFCGCLLFGVSTANNNIFDTRIVVSIILITAGAVMMLLSIMAGQVGLVRK